MGREVINNRYELIEENPIEGGTKWIVRKAYDLNSGSVVAIKRIANHAFSQQLIEEFMHRIFQMQSLRHPNVVRVLSLIHI